MHDRSNAASGAYYSMSRLVRDHTESHGREHNVSCARCYQLTVCLNKSMRQLQLCMRERQRVLDDVLCKVDDIQINYLSQLERWLLTHDFTLYLGSRSAYASSIASTNISQIVSNIILFSLLFLCNRGPLDEFRQHSYVL